MVKGGDRLIMGNASRAFYADEQQSGLKTGGYALVTDFESKDTIRLHGEAIDYRLKRASGSLSSGIEIYLSLKGKEELIGIYLQPSISRGVDILSAQIRRVNSIFIERKNLDSFLMR